MSTRAVVKLSDFSENTISLYCYKDGYICGGVGEWLYSFCANYKGKSGVPEVLYSILKSNNSWLESKPYIDESDYEYEIDCSNGLNLLLSCWELSRKSYGSVSGDGSIRHQIDVEQELSSHKEIKWPGLSCCPFCGKKPATVFSSIRGSTVRCDNGNCKGHSLIGWFRVMHDAGLAWNSACNL
jgi:hypothetical protein